MGSGAFTFGERKPGSHWTGKRFDGYFRQGQPYLDSFRAVSMSGAAMLNAIQGGQVMAEFRGISPAEKARVAGPKVTFQEAPWLSGLILSFNIEQKPFDDVRVRRALNLALDRWGSAPALARVSQVMATGSLLRPATPMRRRKPSSPPIPAWAATWHATGPRQGSCSPRRGSRTSSSS